MFKDYKKWFELKPKINNTELPNAFHVNVGEVWWCSFGENIGIETDGKGLDFLRPALVIKFFNKKHVWVVPITNSSSGDKFHVKINSFSSTSSVTISQLRAISTNRLIKFMGKISVEDFSNIVKLIISLLEKENPTLGGGISRPLGNNGLSLTDDDTLST